jgi:hypothetical protein
MFWNVEASIPQNPLSLSRPVMGLLYPYLLQNYNVVGIFRLV